MNGQRRHWLQAACLAPWLASCAVLREDTPPPLPREFRGAWVATVANIDWPSRPGLPTATQRAEMHALLEHAQATGLNAIVLQVRASADAIYPSTLEPWSEYLTGTSGLAPDPPWDPLAEWVQAAHRLGLELHAWFNPYRARHPSARSEPAPTHVVNTQPGLVRAYGEHLWLDPAEPLAATRMLEVVSDVLHRYDIDGVHIDDYFYPYPVLDGRGVELPFPDDDAWARQLESGAPSAVAADPDAARAAWRRAHVDALVLRLYQQVHAIKPWVRVGISPFGLPRPDLRPAGISGFSQYDKLYADVERWLAEGWLDYLAPQLYWSIDSPAQAFEVLQQTWRTLNTRQRHLWPGLFTSRIGAARNAYDAAEVLAQVALTRHAGAAADGHLHFSMAALLQDRDGVATRLRGGPYAEPALTPATPWLAEPPPQAPLFDWSATRRELTLHPGAGPPLRQAVLWTRAGGHWHWQALPLPQTRRVQLADPIASAWLVGIGRSRLASAARRVF